MKAEYTAMDSLFSLPQGSAGAVSIRKMGPAMLEGLTHSTRLIPAVQKHY